MQNLIRTASVVLLLPRSVSVGYLKSDTCVTLLRRVGGLLCFVNISPALRTPTSGNYSPHGTEYERVATLGRAIVSSVDTPSIGTALIVINWSCIHILKTREKWSSYRCQRHFSPIIQTMDFYKYIARSHTSFRLKWTSPSSVYVNTTNISACRPECVRIRCWFKNTSFIAMPKGSSQNGDSWEWGEGWGFGKGGRCGAFP